MYTSVINLTIKTWWYTKITWMMVGRRACLRPISKYPITINILSNIEQGIVSNIFRPTYTSCTITPTIFYSGVRVSGMGTIPNSPIITNSISWWSQQYTTFNLVMGGIVDGMRPISTSPFNINYFSPIARGRVAGLLWPRPTSTNTSSVITRGICSVCKIPMSTTSVMSRGRLAGLKIPMPTDLLIRRHFKTFFLRNSIVLITAVGGRMAGIMILIS